MKYLIILILLSSCASEYKRIDNRVNNLITYKWDDVDYWQTPSETLSLGTGDCEDYAILKYNMMQDSTVNFVFVQFAIGEYHLMLEKDGIYYDSKMKNRGTYDKDFTTLERFTIDDTIKFNNDKFQDMKTRHFDNTHSALYN